MFLKNVYIQIQQNKNESNQLWFYNETFKNLYHIIKGLEFQDEVLEMVVFYAIWDSDKLFWP